MGFVRASSLLFVLSLNFILIYSVARKSKAPDKCTTCATIAEKFVQGLKHTSKLNFGGGNTRWEEQNLGSYAYSETRFIEIMDEICIGEGKECHQMLEAHEELLESWWKKYYSQGIESDLREFFCVRRTKVCCPLGTYGLNCRECKGGKKNPCNRNGRCEGDGTREGTGNCICEAGFEGELCQKCSDGFYDKDFIRGETSSSGEPPANYRPNCIPCHQSCKSTCSGEGPQGCRACKDGWVKMDGTGCSDMNECDDDSMCAPSEFCTNTDGSYKCTACHKACSTCTGPKLTDCITCNVRYRRNNDVCTACHESCAKSCADDTAKSCDRCRKGWKVDEGGVCQDVDECQMTNMTLRCSVDEYCVNTVGSYKCSTCHPNCHGCLGAGNDRCEKCKDGFRRNEEGSCVDIDECLQSEKACPAANERCVNLPGTYRCDCSAGYRKQGGLCIPSSKADYESSRRSSSSSSYSSAPDAPKRSYESSKKPKKVKKNVPFYKRELPQYLARLAAFSVTCSLAKQRLLLQTALTAFFAGYMYYYASELDLAFKQTYG